jgi:hypothetical protein
MDAWNVGSTNDFLLGQKLARGGQAEIFEVENYCTKKNKSISCTHSFQRRLFGTSSPTLMATRYS